MAITHDMVNMQLGHHIAKRSDIDLVGAEGILEGFAQPAGFIQQLLPINLIELEYLTDILTLRNKNKLGILRIVCQKKFVVGTRR